jgi:hypothetical protein
MASMYINGGYQDKEFMLSNLTTALKQILPKMSKRATGKQYIGQYWDNPDMLNGIEIRALRWPWQHTDNEQYGYWHCHAGGSCQDEPAGRVPHEGGGYLPCNAQH